jgi:hypothetical protein
LCPATNIRAAILAGTFRAKPESLQVAATALPFRAFADVWKERRGKHLVSAPLDVYRLTTICAFVLSTEPWLVFGDKRLDAITVDDIERSGMRAGPKDSPQCR